jgi:hypothetical protein
MLPNHEQQHDGGVAAEHDAREARAGRDDLLGRAHRAQQAFGVEVADHADDRGNHQAEDDPLHCGARRGVDVFFTDAPCDERHRADRHAHRHGVDDGQHRLGEADGGDGVRAEVRDPEDVDHGEDRFHDHFHDHGHGEHHDRAADRRRGVVHVDAAHGVAQNAPSGRRWRIH